MSEQPMTLNGCDAYGCALKARHLASVRISMSDGRCFTLVRQIWVHHSSNATIHLFADLLTSTARPFAALMALQSVLVWVLPVLGR